MEVHHPSSSRNRPSGHRPRNLWTQTNRQEILKTQHSTTEDHHPLRAETRGQRHIRNQTTTIQRNSSILRTLLSSSTPEPRTQQYQLIGQTEYAATLRQTDEPIIVEASYRGTDLIKQVELIGRHRIQVTPESCREALLSVDQLIKQHGYNYLNDLQLIPAHLSLEDLTPTDVIKIPRTAARKEWRLSMQTLANLPAVTEDNRTRTTSTYQDPTAAKTAILIYSAADPLPPAPDKPLQPTDSLQLPNNTTIPVQTATNPTQSTPLPASHHYPSILKPHHPTR